MAEQTIPKVFETDEPQILFLGTASMKPTPYRGASAIYYFTKQGCVLMDSAEGSYGQLWDHFGNKKAVDNVLLKTRVIFITHIHGDHQLGILKMMQERDILLSNQYVDQREKLYVVVPTPMMKWMELYHANLKNPDLTHLIPSNLLNPEQFYYYQKWDQGYYLDIEKDNSRP